MNVNAADWMLLAKCNADVALTLKIHGYYPACMMYCQRAIEKALKAVPVNAGRLPKKKHALAFLAKDAGVLDEMETEWLDLMDTLSALYTETGYPDDIEMRTSIDSDMCESAISGTEAIIKWIETKL